MLLPKTVLYYSTSTKLAHHINTLFYGQHFLWCAPVFDPLSLDALDPRRKIPVSSSPKNIYKRYTEDVEGEDTHSKLIEQNRQGIKNGALYKLKEKVITKREFAQINVMVDKASFADFRPILYLIPLSIVKSRLKQVPVEDVANPLGIEFRIEDLLTSECEIITY